MDVFSNQMVGIFSQCIHVSNLHDVHFKYLTTVFVKCTSIKLPNERDNDEAQANLYPLDITPSANTGSEIQVSCPLLESRHPRYPLSSPKTPIPFYLKVSKIFFKR